MRKHLQTLGITALLGCTAMSAATTRKALSEITSESGIDCQAFVYDDKGLLERRDVADEYGRYYELYIHDELGRLEKQECWQWFDKEGYTLVNYLEFQFNEQGLVSQRENFNLDRSSNTFIKGGCLKYDYDDEGRIQKLTTYLAGWDGGDDELFSIVDYTYSPDGLLVKETTEQVDWFDPSVTYRSSMVEYEYDGEGRRSEVINWYYNQYENPDEPRLINTCRYSYDENGLWRIETVSASGNVSSKDEYSFTTEDASGTVWPVTFEQVETNFVYENISRQIEERVSFDTDINTGNLLIYDTYYYHYDDIPAGVGGAGIPESPLRVIADGENVMIGGVGDGGIIRIYDMSGVLKAQVCSSGSRVEVSGLTPGVYIATTPAGTVKFRR